MNCNSYPKAFTTSGQEFATSVSTTDFSRAVHLCTFTLHQEQAYLCILMTNYFGVGGKTIRLNSRPNPAASGFRSSWPPWPQGPVLLWHKVQDSPVTLVIRLTPSNLYTDSHRNRVQVHPATTKLWVPDQPCHRL